MKLASFCFILGWISVILFLPAFVFSEKENAVKVTATVLEHISYSEKNGSLTATTNIKNGYWIIDNRIVVSGF